MWDLRPPVHLLPMLSRRLHRKICNHENAAVRV